MTIDRDEWFKGLTATGKYRPIAELGRGGMANVYLALMRGHRGFHKLVVLKVPNPSVAENPDMMEMFREEARLAARLNHPNIVQTYEVVQEGDRDVTVMEYLDGQSLHKLIRHAKRSGQSVPCGMHLHILSDALTGLHYAHEAKDFDGRPLELVHRDVSPPNVFVTFDGAVKILDFGIAKTAESTVETAYGTFKGKVRYMSPEHLLGHKVDRRADVFAIGAMMWEAAVGEPLWQERADVEIVSAVISKRVPSPRSVCPSVPAALDAIVTKAMAHDRDERHANCLELRADIEAFLASQDERYTANDLRAKMDELFAPLRAERQRRIETQLRDVSAESTAQNFALPRDPASLHSGARWPTAVHEAGPSSMSPSVRGIGVDMSAGAPDGSAPGAFAWKRRSKVLALGAFALFAFCAMGAMGLAGIGVPTMGAREPIVPAESASTTARSLSPEVEPRQKDVVIVVRTEPADARLFVDGVAVQENPWIHHGPALLSAAHDIRAESKGYATRGIHVPMDKDSDTVIRLAKDAAGPGHVPSRGASARPAAGAASAASAPAAPVTNTAPASGTGAATRVLVSKGPTPTPASASKTVRPVDTSDPWSR